MADHWKSNTYPPLYLSDKQRDDCRRIRSEMVRETLQNWGDIQGPEAFEQERWKLVRVKRGIHVYRERSSFREEGVDKAHIPFCPRLLMGVGYIQGSLDDVLYGTSIPDDAAMMQLGGYSQLNIADAQRLASIEGPTPDQPYHTLKIQWHISTVGPALSTVVKGRDMVYIKATGMLSQPNGERIGYNLYHSIDLPSVPLLNKRDIRRTRLSACSLFKQTSPGVVSVFVKGYVEAFGRVLDKIALSVAAEGLTTCSNSVECSSDKKLSWLLQYRYAVQSDDEAPTLSRHAQKSICSACYKRFSAIRKRRVCVLCSSFLCRSCSIERLKVDIVPFLRAKKTKIHLCRRCNHTVGQESAYKLARQEVLAGRFENSNLGTTQVNTDRMLASANHPLMTDQSFCDGNIPELHSFSFASTSTPMGSFINLATPVSRPSSSYDYPDDMRSFSSSNSFDSLGEQDWDEIVLELQQLSGDARTLTIDERYRQSAWLKMTEQRLAGGYTLSSTGDDESTIFK